jgi:HD superfamily phosphohydrolase
MHLMHQAIEVLRSKGHEITRDEENGALIAILLHDIGHGPYSHTLENSIVAEISHEELSLIFMEQLNTEFSGALSTAIAIFKNDYPKHFLHQLVSSQLDMDRLDYLKRDSFFTGVSEGVINTDRIIKMLDMVDDELVVEAKGIYSVEKFIIARRLMYWQVYLHKTVLSAENMLMQVIRRARFLALNGEKLFATDPFGMFLQNEIGKDDFIKNPSILETFGELDDFDVFASIKMWTKANDKVLSTLSQNLVNRQLFRNEIQNKPFSRELVTGLKQKTATLYGISAADADYFVFSDIARNSAYNPFNDRINILFRDGKVQDITEASDQLNIEILSKTVTKYFLCYPKQVAGL